MESTLTPLSPWNHGPRQAICLKRDKTRSVTSISTAVQSIGIHKFEEYP